VVHWTVILSNTAVSINWRASLVPAAAVIPALVVYINIVVVRKLVVSFLAMRYLGKTKNHFDVLFAFGFIVSCEIRST